MNVYFSVGFVPRKAIFWNFSTWYLWPRFKFYTTLWLDISCANDFRLMEIHFIKNVHIRSFSDWYFTLQICIFSPNAGAYGLKIWSVIEYGCGPERLQIRTLFMQWISITETFQNIKYFFLTYKLSCNGFRTLNFSWTNLKLIK